MIAITTSSSTSVNARRKSGLEEQAKEGEVDYFNIAAQSGGSTQYSKTARWATLAVQDWLVAFGLTDDRHQVEHFNGAQIDFRVFEIDVESPFG